MAVAATRRACVRAVLLAVPEMASPRDDDLLEAMLARVDRETAPEVAGILQRGAGDECRSDEESARWARVLARVLALAAPGTPAEKAARKLLRCAWAPSKLGALVDCARHRGVEPHLLAGLIGRLQEHPARDRAFEALALLADRALVEANSTAYDAWVCAVFTDPPGAVRRWPVAVVLPREAQQRVLGALAARCGLDAEALVTALAMATRCGVNPDAAAERLVAAVKEAPTAGFGRLEASLRETFARALVARMSCVGSSRNARATREALRRLAREDAAAASVGLACALDHETAVPAAFEAVAGACPFETVADACPSAADLVPRAVSRIFSASMSDEDALALCRVVCKTIVPSRQELLCGARDCMLGSRRHASLGRGGDVLRVLLSTSLLETGASDLLAAVGDLLARLCTFNRDTAAVACGVTLGVLEADAEMRKRAGERQELQGLRTTLARARDDLVDRAAAQRPARDKLSQLLSRPFALMVRALQALDPGADLMSARARSEAYAALHLDAQADPAAASSSTRARWHNTVTEVGDRREDALELCALLAQDASGSPGGVALCELCAALLSPQTRRVSVFSNARFFAQILETVAAAPDPCASSVIDFAVFLAEHNLRQVRLSTLAELFEKAQGLHPAAETRILGMMETLLTREGEAADHRFTDEAGAVLERLAAIFLKTVRSTGMTASQFRVFGSVLSRLVPVASVESRRGVRSVQKACFELLLTIDLSTVANLRVLLDVTLPKPAVDAGDALSRIVSLLEVSHMSKAELKRRYRARERVPRIMTSQVSLQTATLHALECLEDLVTSGAVGLADGTSLGLFGRVTACLQAIWCGTGPSGFETAAMTKLVQVTQRLCSASIKTLGVLHRFRMDEESAAYVARFRRRQAVASDPLMLACRPARKRQRREVDEVGVDPGDLVRELAALARISGAMRAWCESSRRAAPRAAAFLERLQETLFVWAEACGPRAARPPIDLEVKAEDVVPLQQQGAVQHQKASGQRSESPTSPARPLVPKRRIVELCKALEGLPSSSAAEAEEVRKISAKVSSLTAAERHGRRRRRRSENPYIDEGLEEMEAEGDSDGYEDLEGFVVCPGDSSYFQ